MDKCHVDGGQSHATRITSGYFHKNMSKEHSFIHDHSQTLDVLVLALFQNRSYRFYGDYQRTEINGDI
jgi:hypothetical protein